MSTYKIRWETETLFTTLATLDFCLEDTPLTHPLAELRSLSLP
ncbi:hypothetical protein NEOC65_002003 [Neochlamydia sp. AcF65]|nr:hypothetical protein [Neochlamydia sp. AcF65]